ncbi:MAG: M48 family metalloprotease [Alphaproteobacteria bacterium]|nr:M48 family metalloprotease [Alphaproteobacteria bacterium]
MSDLPWPPNPVDPPAHLGAVTPAYRRQLAAVLLGLGVFLAIYLGLLWYLLDTVWVAWSRLGCGGLLLASPALLLSLFLLSGLLAVKRGALGPDAIEVTAEDEPALLAFVHRVADEVGAPRPHKVFLVSGVQAAVFFDLAAWNLLLPTRKNLMLGLGLVNVATLDELKAVLAHEFGHFAQRSTGVSRYAYTSMQIVAHLVGHRGRIDGFLHGLSVMDLRIAWIGWVLRLIVWSMRAVLDTVFRGLLFVERALSREMEFQADLVSVRLAGSDSLVHALSRLVAADEAWDRALDLAAERASRDEIADDLYAVQTRIVERLGQVRDEPTFGATPARPEAEPATFRVFSRQAATAPQMWSTHPTNPDREENAKRTYLASTLDPRPAWVLFSDPKRLCRQTTARVLAMLEPQGETADLVPAVDVMFDALPAQPRFRGMYLGRSVVRAARRTADLVGELSAEPGRDAVVARLDALYPESLVPELRTLREHVEELALLEGLRDGLLEAPGGVVRFRGRELPRRELAETVELVRGEVKAEAAALAEHDREVRTAHRLAARLVDPGWERCLEGLLGLLHLVEHARADLQDAHAVLGHTVKVAMADGSVSTSEQRRIASVAHDAYVACGQLYGLRAQVAPPIADEPHDLSALLPADPMLPPPAVGNLAQWLPAFAAWAGAVDARLSAIGPRVLTCLLRTEDEVAAALRDGVSLAEAPPACVVPAHHATLVPGEERERTDRLSAWDRFQTADGWLAGGARLAVAGGILGTSALATGWMMVGTDVTVTNGLAIPVVVQLGAVTLHVDPGAADHVTLDGDDLVLRTTTEEGATIEELEVDLGGAPSAGMVYDVASAAVLSVGTVVYGPGPARPARVIGAPRWSRATVDVPYGDPPEQIEVPKGAPYGTRTVLLSDGQPSYRVLTSLPRPERDALVAAHLRWDPAATLSTWSGLAEPADLPVLAQRSDAEEQRLALGAFAQDVARAAADPTVCERHVADATAHPDDLARRLLAARCGDDEGVLALWTAHPEDVGVAWEALAALTHLERWEEAAALAARVAVDRDPRLVLRLSRLVGTERPPLPTDAALGPVLAIEDDPDAARAAAAASPELELVMLLAGGVPTTASLDAAQPDVSRRFLPLVAASDGVIGAIVVQAIEAGEGVDTWADAVAVASLAVREGRPPPPAALELLGHLPGGSVVVAALDRERLATPGWLDEQLRGVDVGTRARARLVGCIVLGDEAPGAWRKEARALLLPWERPWLHP